MMHSSRWLRFRIVAWEAAWKNHPMGDNYVELKRVKRQKHGPLVQVNSGRRISRL